MLSRIFRKPPRERIEPSFDEGYRSGDDGTRLSADPDLRPHLSADPDEPRLRARFALFADERVARSTITEDDDQLLPTCGSGFLSVGSFGRLPGLPNTNPATGLLMVGAVDVAGNAYGFDNSGVGGTKFGLDDF